MSDSATLPWGFELLAEPVKLQCRDSSYSLSAKWKTEGRIIQLNLSWSRIRAKFCQLIANLFVMYSNLNWQYSNLSSFLTLTAKKKDMNIDKLAVNWQNFTRVRLQLKFAFIIWLLKSWFDFLKSVTKHEHCATYCKHIFRFWYFLFCVTLK